jgi:hypothetical protein
VADPLDGVLDHLTPHFIGVRTADGLYRFFRRDAWGMPAGLGHHLFAAGVEHEKTERAWQGWLNDLFEEAQ